MATMQIRRHISLDEDTDRKLQQLAAREHKNVSQWITDAVWEKMEKLDHRQRKAGTSIYVRVQRNKWLPHNTRSKI